MNNKRLHTACFTGHREIPPEEYPGLKSALMRVITALYNRGIIYYGNGAAYGFDLLAAECVLELKERYDDIKLIMVLPFINQTEKWKNKADIDMYNNVLKQADKVKPLSQRYNPDCYAVRNQHLVDCSSVCIAYCKNDKSGAAQTIRMAERQHLKVYNLASKPLGLISISPDPLELF